MTYTLSLKIWTKITLVSSFFDSLKFIKMKLVRLVTKFDMPSGISSVTYMLRREKESRVSYIIIRLSLIQNWIYLAKFQFLISTCSNIAVFHEYLKIWLLLFGMVWERFRNFLIYPSIYNFLPIFNSNLRILEFHQVKYPLEKTRNTKLKNLDL